MPASAGWVRRGTVMISDKIRPQHLERKAILYVRQSSAHQVLHNRESSALQYAMRDRLTTLGWSEIEVIDDDLGRSAAGGVQRAGFERMVAQVCLGKVGAVAAREVSRFARNSRDWQQLMRCAGGRYRAGRSGDGLCASSWQRSASARPQRKSQRVLPVPAVAGEPRDLARGNGANLAETDLRHHPLKTGALDAACSGTAKIIIDH